MDPEDYSTPILYRYKYNIPTSNVHMPPTVLGLHVLIYVVQHLESWP
jgi:hypothetical protein